MHSALVQSFRIVLSGIQGALEWFVAHLGAKPAAKVGDMAHSFGFGGKASDIVSPVMTNSESGGEVHSDDLFSLTSSFCHRLFISQ